MTMVKTLEVIGKILSVAMVLMGLGYFVAYLIGGQALYDSLFMAHYGIPAPRSVIWPELGSLVFMAMGIYNWKRISD